MSALTAKGYSLGDLFLHIRVKFIIPARLTPFLGFNCAYDNNKQIYLYALPLLNPWTVFLGATETQNVPKWT